MFSEYWHWASFVWQKFVVPSFIVKNSQYNANAENKIYVTQLWNIVYSAQIKNSFYPNRHKYANSKHMYCFRPKFKIINYIWLYLLSLLSIIHISTPKNNYLNIICKIITWMYLYNEFIINIVNDIKIPYKYSAVS